MPGTYCELKYFYIGIFEMIHYSYGRTLHSHFVHFPFLFNQVVFIKRNTGVDANCELSYTILQFNINDRSETN